MKIKFYDNSYSFLGGVIFGEGGTVMHLHRRVGFCANGNASFVTTTMNNLWSEKDVIAIN